MSVRKHHFYGRTDFLKISFSFFFYISLVATSIQSGIVDFSISLRLVYILKKLRFLLFCFSCVLLAHLKSKEAELIDFALKRFVFIPAYYNLIEFKMENIYNVAVYNDYFFIVFSENKMQHTHSVVTLYIYFVVLVYFFWSIQP